MLISRMDMILPKISAAPKICAVIADFLKRHKISDLCTFSADDSNAGKIQIHYNQDKVYFSPVRLGTILDYLIEISNKNEKKESVFILLGNAKIDCLHGLYKQDGKESVRLTEKEIEILTYLYKHNARIVQKQELLTAVWAYAENVETHTLETHIYRLRQKIEADPSSPKYLVTEENGYRLC